jgi:hypothetical protein
MPATLLLLTALYTMSSASAPTDDADVRVGAARVDITPEGPIRLTGYGNRKTESDGVEQHLWARAIAMSQADSPPFVVVTLEVCGIPIAVRNQASARLQVEQGVPADHLAVCVTHTHSGPAVSGYAPMIHPDDPSPDQAQRIEAHTARLVDAIVDAAGQALNSRRPAKLGWGVGNAPFAANRRVVKDGKWTGFGVQPEAPIDRSVPALFATDPDGKPIASLIGYACHCTTLGGEYNKICGDWAGYASEKLEADHPGSVALIVIGCAGDANPEPRGSLDQAKTHGLSLAAEVERLRTSALHPLPAPTEARLETIQLPFEKAPTLEQWKAQAGRMDQVGRRARYFVGLLERGEPAPESLPYTIQTWSFGDRLVFVLLAGEVVLDYATALRTRLDPARLWLVAYANEVPCYIASKRILREGGYEADDSMIYYNRPTRLAPEAEDRLLDAAQSLAPAAFRQKP